MALRPTIGAWSRLLRSARFVAAGGLLLLILLSCLGTLPWTSLPQSGSRLFLDAQVSTEARLPPSLSKFALWLGTDHLGRSVMGRILVGGAISLGIGIMAAGISVIMGVGVGLVAGYAGGWLDNLIMRGVDLLYSLPYVLMVILLKIALEPVLGGIMSPQAANLAVLFTSIGLVSWLTMARVVRGQVFSLRSQPFVEACHALGVPGHRTLLRHILPNLAGPVIVYATLIIPQAILQESFLSFLGIGVQPPVPTWGSLAGEGLSEGLIPIESRPWLLIAPCAMLAVTLLSLNFLGDALRDALDPKRNQRR